MKVVQEERTKQEKSVQAVSTIKVFVYILLVMAESTNACICGVHHLHRSAHLIAQASVSCKPTDKL